MSAPLIMNSTSAPALCSVALCTYNGEKYLQQQLDSIAGQDTLPLELVVCDDGSTDGTIRILERFAASAPFPVRIVTNQQNLGSSANFAQAVSLCHGEFIALADQDDLWLPNKLSSLQSALRENERVAYAFSDAELIDAAGLPLPSTLWRNVGLRASVIKRFHSGDSFRVLLKENRVTGATMALRACYRDFLLPVPSGWVHDAWFALALSAVADCRLIPLPLIRYRLHQSQQIGARRLGYVGQFQAARRMSPARFEQILSGLETLRLRLQGMPEMSPSKWLALDQAIDHWTARRRMRQSTRLRLPAILAEAARGRYRRYSRGWKSLAQDLVM